MDHSVNRGSGRVRDRHALVIVVAIVALTLLALAWLVVAPAAGIC
jgi:hypothetical protein